MASFSVLVVLMVIFSIGLIGDVTSQPPPPLLMANIYGDHMVLQQAPSQALIWGYVSACDSKLSATFNGKTYTPTSSGDTLGGCVWKLLLPPTKGDLTTTYTITVTSDKYGSATINDVLFGDVWVCSGQSNMAFTVKNVFNASEEIADAINYPKIRLFTAARNTSTTPRAQLIGIEQPWSVASPTSVGGGNATQPFSAACWFFGRDIFKFLNYPIGLIATDWGGTPVEAWSSPEALSKCKTESKSRRLPTKKKAGWGKAERRVGGPSDPSVLWNAMIFPFLNMTIKGAIWYQGEANANSGHPELYSCSFPAMIDDWRSKWYQGTMQQTTPLYFGFVQLAPDGTTNVTVGGFPVIRWGQTANYGYVPNDRMKDVFMAVAIDLGDPTSPMGSVHPRYKQDVGTRLSIGARAVVFNDPSVYYLGMLPQTAKMSTESTANLTSVAIAYGPPNEMSQLELRYPYGFEVGCIDSSGKTPPQWIEGTAKSVSGSDVNVEFPLCPQNLKPMKVRYCWRTDPCTFYKCPIYSSPMTPSPPFVMDLV